MGRDNWSLCQLRLSDGRPDLDRPVEVGVHPVISIMQTETYRISACLEDNLAFPNIFIPKVLTKVDD